MRLLFIIALILGPEQNFYKNLHRQAKAYILAESQRHIWKISAPIRVQEIPDFTAFVPKPSGPTATDTMFRSHIMRTPATARGVLDKVLKRYHKNLVWYDAAPFDMEKNEPQSMCSGSKS